jgi:hypothetical protein
MNVVKMKSEAPDDLPVWSIRKEMNDPRYNKGLVPQSFWWHPHYKIWWPICYSDGLMYKHEAEQEITRL